MANREEVMRKATEVLSEWSTADIIELLLCEISERQLEALVESGRNWIELEPTDIVRMKFYLRLSDREGYLFECTVKKCLELLKHLQDEDPLYITGYYEEITYKGKIVAFDADKDGYPIIAKVEETTA